MLQGCMLFLVFLGAGGTIDSVWANFATPLIVIFIVAALGLLFRTATKRYVKVPPEKALIVYGGGKTRVVSGGAKFVWPLVEDFYLLDLAAFQFDVALNKVPNKDNVPINVKTSVTCKISNNEDLLPVAAGAFGQKNIAEIKAMVQGVIDGHIRVLIGKSAMETVLRDQDTFKASIQKEVTQELAKLGCEVIVLNIQEVSDPGGVIEAMGKPEAARVKADAAIQEAEQTRRQTVQTTTANMEAATTAAQNEAKVAEAQRDRDIKKAGFAAETAKAQATSEQAQPLASAEARKDVVKAEVEVQKTQTLAEIDLQEAVGRKTEAELNATVLKQANAEKQRLVTVAEGEKQKAIITSEGTSQARKTNAEAEKIALQAEGEGEAAKTKATGEAAAAAEQAMLMARAAGAKANLLAEADGQTALAQATKAQLDAYKGMDEQQKKLFMMKMVLENLPEVVEKMGEAGQKIMGEIAKTVTASLSQIDNVTIYDSSSNGKGGALERFASVGPSVLFDVIQGLKKTGTLSLVQGALDQAGIDMDLLKLTGANGRATAAPPSEESAEGRS